MKLNLFLMSLVFSFSFSQFDWLDDGLPVRQGGHIEWQRSGTVGNDGEMIYVWNLCLPICTWNAFQAVSRVVF